MLEIADGPFRVDKRGEVKLIQSLDYESQTSHQLIIWATDGLTVNWFNKSLQNELLINF